MKLKVVFFLLIFSHLIVNAQVIEIESTLNRISELRNAKPPAYKDSIVNLAAHVHTAFKSTTHLPDSLFAELCHEYGRVLYELEEYDTAEEILAEAWRIKFFFCARQDWTYLKTTYQNATNLYKVQQLDLSEFYLKEVLQYANSVKEERKRQTLLRLAHSELVPVYIDKGEFAIALKYLKQAKQYGYVRPSLEAIVYAKMGNLDKAISILELSAEKEVMLDPDLLNNLGRVYHDNKAYELAEKLYDEILLMELLQETRCNIYSNQVINYTKMRAFDKASKALRLGLALAKKAKNELVISELYQYEGQLLAAQDQYVGALDAYQRAIFTLVPSSKSTKKYANPDLSKPIIGKSRLIDILSLKAQHLAVSTSSDPTALYKNYDTYCRLDTLITQARLGHQHTESKFLSIAKAIPIYERGIEAALKLYGKTGQSKYLEQAFNFARRNKAAIHHEALKKREVLQQLAPEKRYQENELKKQLYKLEKQVADGDSNLESKLLDTYEQHQRLIDEIKQEIPTYYDMKYAFADLPTSTSILNEMPKQMAILEYFVGDNKVYLFVLHPESGLQHYVLSDKEQLSELTASFLKSDMEEDAEFLYQELLASALNDLPKTVKRLRIVPDDILNTISFEVLQLPNENKNDYLIYHYAFSYAISGQEHHFQRDYTTAGTYLGIGSDYKKRSHKLKDEKPLNPLVHAKNELDASAQYYQDITLKINGAATKKVFKEAIGKYRIIHLTLHGIIDLENAWNTKISFDDDDLELQEFYTMPYAPSNLLILSVCDTDNGLYRKGEGVQGLSRAAQYAGAESVLASRWYAGDFTASEIIPLFHKYLTQNLPIDIALQRAKQDYLSNSNSKTYTFPEYWANFVLIGNPSVI